MENFPLVSVIIPCYNHEKYVSDTLNSVLEDTYPNKEICIIDDGSKDGSVSVIEDWIRLHGEEVCVKFRTRANKGVCPTLNELIRMAEGKYLVPCASDDMLYGNTITERVAILEMHPDRKVLVSDAIVINQGNEVIMNSSMEDYNHGDKSLYQTDDGMIRGVILQPCISGPTFMVCKNVYDVIGYYPEHLKAEDWWFFQRVVALGFMLFDDRKVSLYRVHGLNISADNSSHKIILARTIIKTLEANLFFFREWKWRILVCKQLIRFNYIILRLKIGNCRKYK